MGHIKTNYAFILKFQNIFSLIDESNIFTYGCLLENGVGFSMKKEPSRHLKTRN